jgi:hypothetical protein
MSRPRKPNEDALRVACPKCGRRAGLLCASKAHSDGPWEGYSLKVHTERKQAAGAPTRGRAR